MSSTLTTIGYTDCKLFNIRCGVFNVNRVLRCKVDSQQTHKVKSTQLIRQGAFYFGKEIDMYSYEMVYDGDKISCLGRQDLGDLYIRDSSNTVKIGGTVFPVDKSVITDNGKCVTFITNIEDSNYVYDLMRKEVLQYLKRKKSAVEEAIKAWQ